MPFFSGFRFFFHFFHFFSLFFRYFCVFFPHVLPFVCSFSFLDKEKRRGDTLHGTPFAKPQEVLLVGHLVIVQRMSTRNRKVQDPSLGCFCVPVHGKILKGGHSEGLERSCMLTSAVKLSACACAQQWSKERSHAVVSLSLLNSHSGTKVLVFSLCVCANGRFWLGPSVA